MGEMQQWLWREADHVRLSFVSLDMEKWAWLVSERNEFAAKPFAG
jgi:hypothetical protein